ncbi:MAG: DUF305 domain-containing protein [Kofleriaceae bacterium]|nr:MAG: DUF305 domain-containing protein [Kofleriaceae bacterium]MBZ0237993.1 DUF305 domain-containing protein [Kofleriaceae bacterium]
MATTHAGTHSAGHARDRSHSGAHASAANPYLMLLLSVAISYVVMCAIMFSMVDRWGNVYLNLSQVYMTGLMAGSMVPIMLLTMPGMFKSRRANAALWVGSAAVLALCWGLLRAEAGVRDRQFLRAMISHHAAAVQMCNESSLSDPRVLELCRGIISSQEREIAEMKALLGEGD